MRQLSTIALCLALTSCSGHYQFNSNLDKENFENYLPATDVEVVTEQYLTQHSHQYLAVVEGISCQEKANQAPPQAVDARNELREQAAELGANAVVIQQCYNIEEPQGCIAMLSCFGKAYQIEE